MKKYFSILFVAFYLNTSAQQNIQSFLDSLASSYLRNKTGSLVIGIHDNGKEHVYYFGETEKGNAVLPDEKSIFEIGNITETFTCILFADLTLKGQMHIDDKLQNFLPVNIPSPVYQPVVCRPIDMENNYTGQSDEGTMHVHITPYLCIPDSTFKPQPILLCYLASHTSGLPDHPSNFHPKNKSNPYAGYTTDDLFKFLSSYQLDKPIGFNYRQSETGIALLGIAVSRKMKKDYERLLIENILDSLRMYDTRITLDAEKQKRLLKGFSQKGTIAEYWSFDAFAPVGALHSTPSDMMKFLAANISIKKNYYSDLLDYTHNSRLKPGGAFKDDLEIAMGWKISPLNIESKKIVWQNGQTGSFASYIGFVETSHTGVVILSSVSSSVDDIGVQVLQLLERQPLKLD